MHCFKGEQVSFNVSVMTSRNYPVDFYFLMDLSSSLRDDVETLKNTTKNIGINITLHTLC